MAAELQIYAKQNQWRSTVVEHLDEIAQLQGTGSLATNATSGFGYLPSTAGTPTGTPAGTPAGYVPVVIDSTTGKLFAYTSGAWAAV